MSIQFHPFSDFIVVVGMKASGKTTLTKYILKTLISFIIIDPTWQMTELGYCVHFPDRIVPAFQQWKKVVYQPKHMDKETYCKAFEACLSLKNYTLGIDEIDKFARPRFYLAEALNEIINRGRSQGIGLICNSRRPHMMHNDIRSNADYVIAFHLHEERDVKYIAGWFSIPEETISNLPDYHSLLFQVHQHKVIKQLPCKSI